METKPDFQDLIVFGAGGHGREIEWLAQRIWGAAVRVVFAVDDPIYLKSKVIGTPVYLIQDLAGSPTTRLIIGIGDILHRQRADQELGGRFRYTTLIDRSCQVSPSAEIGEGSVVSVGAILSTSVALGRHVHINLAVNLSHDVEIGDFSALSPGVNVAGHVKIGKGVFVGTGATIMSGMPDEPLIIEDGAIVAAGACVTKSVKANSLVAGVPAVKKK